MSQANIIVYPTDFSDASLAAIPWTKRMVSVLDADLHCVFVVEDPHMISPFYGGAIPMPSGQELAQNAQSTMDEFMQKNFGSLDGQPSNKVLIGRPAEKIVEYADSLQAAMIVMATHGYSGVKHLILGSTAEAVLRQSKCPVLSIRSE